MKYITGIYALNLFPVKLKTTGDWHLETLDWKNIPLAESANSPLKDWGIIISAPCIVPCHESEKFNIANHLRACLDLIEQDKFALASGMRNDYISCEDYTLTIFKKVFLFRNSNDWPQINKFMEKEYGLDWVIYKNGLAK